MLAATLRPHVAALATDAARALVRLEQAKPRYAPYPGLYELMAVPLLAATSAPGALTLAAPDNAPAAVKRAVLYERAVALEKAGRRADARRVLHGLAVEFPALIADDAFVADVLRLHLADDDFSDGTEPGSPFLTPEIAADLFSRITSEETIAELGVGEAAPAARAELLFRMLRGKRWEEFVALYDRAGRRAPFTEVETAARTLAATPSDPKGLFNVGYFLKLRNGPEHDCCPCERLANPRPAVNASGHAPLAFYVDALAALEAHPDPALEPKVLSNAIFCFKEDTDGAYCRYGAGDEGVDKSTRAAWFTRLESKYPKSSWSAQTRYWY